MKKITSATIEGINILLGTLFILLGGLSTIYVSLGGWSLPDIFIKFFPPLLLINGIGIFRFKSWARKMTVYVILPYFIIWEPFFNLTIFREPPKDLILYLITNFFFSLIIVIPIHFFLIRPKVKRAFSERNAVMRQS